jgi:hypothetical protein
MVLQTCSANCLCGDYRMNERIKLLALQAGYTKDMFGVGHWDMLECKKFAEMIVRECIGVVEGGSFLHDQAPTAIFARECSSAIKRHFGTTD